MLCNKMYYNFCCFSKFTEETIEGELAGFEKLLSEMMMFKNNASNMSHMERFAYTQNFANAFDDLIDNDGNSDEEQALRPD